MLTLSKRNVKHICIFIVIDFYLAHPIPLKRLKISRCHKFFFLYRTFRIEMVIFVAIGVIKVLATTPLPDCVGYSV
jgi:hypothetical protein